MYSAYDTGNVLNARSQLRINNMFSDLFYVQVGVHQGSVLSPL